VSQTVPRRPCLEHLARISPSSVVGRSAVRLGVNRLRTLSPQRGPGTVDLCADDGMSDAHGVADPHAVNLARW
jgi:hypothetical protein